MSQFVVRVYPTPKGLRVVVDGITDFDVDRMEEVETRARESILGRLETFLPHRLAPDPEPGRSAVLFFDIGLQRLPYETTESGGESTLAKVPPTATPVRTRRGPIGSNSTRLRSRPHVRIGRASPGIAPGEQH